VKYSRNTNEIEALKQAVEEALREALVVMRLCQFRDRILGKETA